MYWLRKPKKKQKMEMMNKVTLVSVVHNEFSLALFRANAELTRRLNSNTEFNWILINNFRDNSEIPSGIQGVTIIPGFFYDSPILAQHPKFPGNMVGLCLDKAINRAETEFVCVVDHDFFILRFDWIEEMTDLLGKNKDKYYIAATYNPRWFSKYNYITSHFLFFNKTKLWNRLVSYVAMIDRPSIRRTIARRVGRICPSLVRRLMRGQSRDNGSQIWEYFGLEPGVFLQPAYDEKTQYFGSKLDKLIDKVLPNNHKLRLSISSVPSRLSEELTEEVEAYFWLEQLFAVHFRSKSSTHEYDENMLNKRLQITQEFAAAALRTDRGRI